MLSWISDTFEVYSKDNRRTYEAHGICRLTSKITIKELNLTNEQISEVRRIQVKVPYTSKRDLIKNVLGCSLCCICSDIPSYLIKEDLHGLTRNTSYCNLHYHSIYEKQKDVDINEIMEMYGCTKAPPGTFGGGKIKEIV